MKFAIAIDGSSASLHALQSLHKLAADWSGPHQFAFINVQQPIPHADAFGLTAGMDGPLLQQMGQRELGPALTYAKDQGLDASGKVDVGPAATCIAEFADEIDADLIVLGTKGRSNLANVLVGSVANRVSAQSKRPVLLIPPG